MPIEMEAVAAGELSPQELCRLLREEDRVYQGKSALEVARMRGWLLCLLAQQPPLPAEALPYVLEEMQAGMDAYLTAAAARALRSYPEANPAFLSHVRAGLANIAPHDQPVDLSVYGGFDGEHPTTPVQELRECERWIERSGSECCAPLPGLGGLAKRVFGRWEAVRGVVLEDQAGRRATFGELFRGRPTIVAFFYTRCENPLKCSRTVYKMAQVQRLLAARSLDGAGQTAAITYDSEFDSAERLARFGANRGLRTGGGHMLLRAVDGIEPLAEYFQPGVSFFQSLVTRHRIEVFLVDSRGLVAESFQRFDWSEDEVVDRAARLLKPAWFGWGPLGGAMAALVPKCPVCWMAYLSAAGFGATAASRFAGSLMIAAAVMLVLNLASLYWRARSTGQWLGLAMAVAGSLLSAARLAGGAKEAAFAGVVLLAAGSIVSAVRTKAN